MLDRRSSSRRGRTRGQDRQCCQQTSEQNAASSTFDPQAFVCAQRARLVRLCRYFSAAGPPLRALSPLHIPGHQRQGGLQILSPRARSSSSLLESRACCGEAHQRREEALIFLDVCARRCARRKSASPMSDVALQHFGKFLHRCGELERGMRPRAESFTREDVRIEAELPAIKHRDFFANDVAVSLEPLARYASTAIARCRSSPPTPPWKAKSLPAGPQGVSDRSDRGLGSFHPLIP